MTVSDTPERERQARIEAIAREAFDRCHPGDSFEDMKRRAPFSKEDRYLLADWLAFAAAELGEREERA